MSTLALSYNGEYYSGMMLFLTIIDIAYFTQHGMFAKEKDGINNLWGLVVPMIVMSALMIVPFILS